MCHLVTDASEEVPRMAYKMLREAAKKRTEYLVVEASIDSDEPVQLDLPLELVQLLQNNFVEVDEDVAERAHNHSLFGYLLTWMLVFDLFTNAVSVVEAPNVMNICSSSLQSLKVKSGYMDHLRRLSLVSDHFLPHIFAILRLHGGMSRPVKLDIWEVDEYYLESKLYPTRR